MKNKVLIDYMLSNNIPFEENVDLKKKTWIHRGGIASVFIIPNNIMELKSIMIFLGDNDIDNKVIGYTSNIYILNDTNIDVVVSTIKCCSFSVYENYIECDCGISVSKLAAIMIDLGISGFEYLTELPGTIGGAICNNSSCKENSISKLLLDLDFVDTDGIVSTLTSDKLHFGFRTSDIKAKILRGTIIKARIKKQYGDKEYLKSMAKNNENERKIILEGPAMNLGCTVNCMFSNGAMPQRYRIPYKLFSKLVSVFVKDNFKQKIMNKKFLLTISGYKGLIPYISDKQLITFIWKDKNADLFFKDYLDFMKNVCKTTSVEIEIV